MTVGGGPLTLVARQPILEVSGRVHAHELLFRGAGDARSGGGERATASVLVSTFLDARLDDVAPDGSHKYVGVEGKLRVSLRATAKAPYETMGLPWHPFTAESAQPLVPGVPVEAQFEFLATSYIFKAGHRIRLTLQFADARSTPKADPAPEITVLHRADAASLIELPLMP